MPTSDPGQIAVIVEALTALSPRTLLDVGIGFGKYGLLAREYLELYGEEPRCAPPWRTTVDGIEVCEAYIGDLQRAICDNIHIGEARHVLSQLPSAAYDCILMVDALEHFERAAARDVVEECLRVGTYALIATPKGHSHQGPLWGNPYEEHRSSWTMGDLSAMAPMRAVPHPTQVVAILSRAAPDRLPSLGRWYVRRLEAAQWRVLAWLWRSLVRPAWAVWCSRARRS